jgi:hypothetical protein
MDIFQPLVIRNVIFVLGFVNVVSGSLIFFSCRCIPGARILGNLNNYAAYRRFFRYHCYIWWVFWPSVMLHAILAMALRLSF